LRVLMLDAGAFLLQSHIQNLPQQLGGKVGGPNYLRTRAGRRHLPMPTSPIGPPT